MLTTLTHYHWMMAMRLYMCLTEPRRVMIRGDLVDGECIACPSVLPSSGARHADVGKMLNINGVLSFLWTTM